MKNKFMEVLHQRGAGRGILPWLLTFLIIILSVLSVSLLDNAEQRYSLRRDYSFNSITTQSAQTEEILRALSHPVHAYALATPGQEDKALIGLLNRLSALSPKFTYSVENLVSNPLLVNMLSSSLQDEAVTADSLILRSEETSRTRVLDSLDFLEQSFDMDQQAYVLAGIRYEASIAGALLYVTSDVVPKVCLLEGHGELSEKETSVMESLLADHHYEVSRLNLLSREAPDPMALVMILSPQVDLADNELETLLRFAEQGGSFLITNDYNDPVLDNFSSLYRFMGFVRKPGIVIADSEDQAAYIDSPVFLTPYMQMTEPTAPLIGSAQTRLRLPGAAAFEMAGNDSLMVNPLLTSGLAFIKQVSRAEVTLVMEEGDEQGQFNLALLSDLAHGNGNHTRAMIIGNSSVLLDSWLHETTYGAQFLLHIADYLSPRKPVNLNIAPKALVKPQLQIVRPWLPLVLLILLPLLVGLSALPILIKRRRR
jgi:hypothetical protein